MTWGKLAGFCSLKAIIVACAITPVTVPATGITAAHAQFNIIIPGFGSIHHMADGAITARARYNRSARRGGRRGQQQQEATSSSGSSGPSTQNLSSSGPQTSPRGYRQSTD